MRQDESQGTNARCVVCVACDASGLLELAGMHKVLWEADRLMSEASRAGYVLHTVSAKGGLIETLQGVTIDTTALDDFDGRPIHTLILPASTGAPWDTVNGAQLMAWLAETLPTVQRVIAAGSAVFLLAQLGALEGRRAVIHGSMSEALKNDAPQVEVDGQSLFTGDDRLWTYAGAASAIDLALALVEADCGRETSLEVARHLAVFVRRPGRHSQVSEMLVSQMVERDVFHDLHVWVQANMNVNARMTVERMAERVSMSTRNFSRVYKRNTGCTPASAIEQFRLEPSGLQDPL